jgi:hypothetical protein
MDEDNYSDADLELEARIFGKYLIGKEISETVIPLYKKAHVKSHFKFYDDDSRILKFLLKYPSLAGIIDGGLALHNRDSVIRKKIFYMLAILETVPEYSEHFLSPKLSVRSTLEFLLFGIRGVYRMILGYFLVKIL